jgi:hypothetical protein
MAPYNIVVFGGDYCGPEVSYLLPLLRTSLQFLKLTIISIGYR